MRSDDTGPRTEGAGPPNDHTGPPDDTGPPTDHTDGSRPRSGDGGVRIERASHPATVAAGAALFDGPPVAAATAAFLGNPGHHLLYAYDGAGRVVGMVSGVETTHPDKGTEMFLYELSVDAGARGRGIGTALVRALAALARQRDCYAMWVGTEADNAAALATYRRAGARDEAPFVMLTWDLAAAQT